MRNNYNLFFGFQLANTQMGLPYSTTRNGSKHSMNLTSLRRYPIEKFLRPNYIANTSAKMSYCAAG